MTHHNYYVYIITNVNKTTLYVGVTNNLHRRLEEHKHDALNAKKSFAGKYNCYWLIYWEMFMYVDQAISRETQIKTWRRQKKEELINSINPEWNFLNETI